MNTLDRALAIAVLVLASFLAAIAYGHHRYDQGVADGVAQQQATQAGVDRQASAEAQKHVTDSAEAGRALHIQIDTTLPAIEVASHDTAQRIHTLYLAAPVAAAGSPDCARPAGVQQQLDAAIARANAAAAGNLRPDPAAPAAAASAPAAQPR